jgi:hypothetical protein
MKIIMKYANKTYTNRDEKYKISKSNNILHKSADINFEIEIKI